MNINDKVLDKIIFFSNRYLDGKDIFPVIRRIIDPLLSISIASFLFERFYFKYEWLDISDYKSILNFFVKGNFIIPLSLYIVVHLLLYFLINSLLRKINNKISKKLFQFKLSESDILSIYKYVKIVDGEGMSLLKMMRKYKDELEKDVCFIFKTILATIFYFIVLPNYGIGLFALMVAILLSSLIGLWFCYLIFDLLPPAVNRLKKQGEKLLERNSQNENQQESIN